MSQTPNDPTDFITSLLEKLSGEANVTVRHIPIEELFKDLATAGVAGASYGYDAGYETSNEDQAQRQDAEAPADQEADLTEEQVGYAKALAFHAYGIRWDFLDENFRENLLDQAFVELGMI